MHGVSTLQMHGVHTYAHTYIHTHTHSSCDKDSQNADAACKQDMHVGVSEKARACYSSFGPEVAASTLSGKPKRSVHATIIACRGDH